MSLSRRSLLSLIAAAPVARAARSATAYWVYVGANTLKNSKGIYVSKLDAESGAFTEPRLAAETLNPLFLKIHPNGRILYAAVELPGMPGRQGGVDAYSIDPTNGKLTFLNQEPTRGVQPIYLDVDQSGKTLLVANYGSGSVAALPIRNDGGLGAITSFILHEGSSVNPQRQAGPHAHCAQISPDNKFALVPDLGLDKMLIYRLNSAVAKLEPAEPPFLKLRDGSGPRHVTFHPGKAVAYLISEMSSTITAMRWNGSRGWVTEMQTISTLPADYAGRNFTAEVRAHPGGEFLYGSNRGHNSISLFAIQPDGTLRLVENTPTEGQTPNSFTLDPAGKWLVTVNQNSDTVVSFSINQADGRLKATGHVMRVDSPAAVRMVAVRETEKF
jgi:6-phosphogluconolactonase